MSSYCDNTGTANLTYTTTGGTTDILITDATSDDCTWTSLGIKPSYDEYPKGVWNPNYDIEYFPKDFIRKSIHYQFKRMWK